MKCNLSIFIIALLANIQLISSLSTETQVKINYDILLILKLSFSAILNVHGNATILIALLFAILYVNPLNAIHLALNLKMLFVMLNAKNLNAR